MGLVPLNSKFSYLPRSIITIASTCVVSALVVGCADQRPAGSNSSSAVYPHPEGWKSSHMKFVAEDDLTGDPVKSSEGQSFAAEVLSRPRCDGCHESSNIKSELQFNSSVNCGSVCHSLREDGSEQPTPPASHVPVVDNECSNCHKPNDPSYIHYPAMAGLCEVCHKADPSHIAGTNNHGVTTFSADDSCFRCHVKDKPMPYAHKALETDKQCANCHNPHGSGFRKILKAEGLPLCKSCHENVIHGTLSVHGPINSEKSCASCHKPHGSVEPKLLVKSQKDICSECHNKEITVGSGNTSRKIKAVTKIIKDMPYTHSPAVNGNCAGACHNPHASDFEHLLSELYPGVVYTPYETDPNSYALCFKCHDSKMLERDITGTETGFRNDTMVNGTVKRQNLHWFHVVAGTGNPEKGRACSYCHDPHAAKQLHNIREKFPFGAYEVGIKFTPDPTGGTCGMTCHGNKSYHRISQ